MAELKETLTDDVEELPGIIEVLYGINDLRRYFGKSRLTLAKLIHANYESLYLYYMELASRKAIRELKQGELTC